MLIVHVFVQVKADQVDAFKAATIDNATHSLQEPGFARFDLIQQRDDPTQFVLIEIYRSAETPGEHKATAHYLRWRDTVAPMMATPRHSLTYHNVFPTDAQWPQL